MAFVPDQKFSTFQDGGNLKVGDIVVGLRSGLNTRFDYTGELPTGIVVGIDQGGTGATTAIGARSNLGLGTIATQDASNVDITGGAAILSSLTATTAALTNGTISSAPVAGTDIVNKTYVDTLVGGSVASVSGTLDRITSTGGVNPVIDIAATYIGQTSITTLGTITSGTWQASAIDLATYVTGNLAVSHLNSGTSASATTYWRGDGTWGTPAGTGVSSVSGTANRITSTGGATPVIDIDATYVGQTSLTTLGTITTGTWNATPVGVIYGGTGLSSIAQGDLIYGSAANTFSALAKNTTATRYLSNTGTSNNPAWAQVDLSNGVTGNLPVTNLNSGTSASASTFWRGDGTWASTTSGSGGLKSFQVFTSGTAATYTRPAGITSILVEVVGGGGGGGGAAGAAASGAGAGGGGSGGYGRLWISSASSSYTYTVGAAGTAGSAGNNNGGTGGTTSFGASLQATGGSGGNGGAAVGNTGASFSGGGIGGVGSNGDINAAGAPGAYGGSVLGNVFSGVGGSSIYGGGGKSSGSGAGNYGSGGYGAAVTTVSTAGGAGTAGLIIVWEFS